MRKPILYDNGWEIELPFKWTICRECEGCGTDRGANVECDGGGFTSEEWAEQDEDFKVDYIAGRYDKPCQCCDGTGKVMTADKSRMSKSRWKAWCEQRRDDAEYEAMCAAERRMGA